MKVTNTGGTIYDIHDDSLRVYNELPPQTYVIRFNPNRGFYLTKYADMEVLEPKIYGPHMKKVGKVLNAFGRTPKNLGVILSGDKGIGKSLTAKLLSIEAVKHGLPVVVVDTYVPGIASYIESIEQEIMVLFDEFDKTFGDIRAGDGEASPQTALLSLFDGVSSGKKLFVITCNSLSKLSNFLVNRPGRFHYHFRFEYPNVDEVKEYLQDQLIEEFHSEIPAIVNFTRKVDINYDCLRSIVFEVNSGLVFDEAIKDLNIVNVSREEYDITLIYDNGVIGVCERVKMDLFSDEMHDLWLRDTENNNFVRVTFRVTDCVFDNTRGVYAIPGKKVNAQLSSYPDDKKTVKAVKDAKIECLTITRRRDKSIHYIV